jgi:hypothetical protein
MNEMRKFRLRMELDGRLYWCGSRVYNNRENAEKKAKELTEKRGRRYWVEENPGSAT